MTGLDAWRATLVAPIAGGARSHLWRVEIGGLPYVARRVTAGEPSLRWLARLQAVAGREGIGLAPLVPSITGALTVAGWTVEPWLAGGRAMSSDLSVLRRRLRRMHRATRRWADRPGLIPREPVHVPRLPEGDRAAVHGDVHPGNILRLSGGGLALIDWEEAHFGDVRLDLGFPATAYGRACHAAAEVRACWRAEPERARMMARRLRMIWT